tara:strand:+ start:213 stop:731 length:519 start_codon:yes stop_codon:yes gene_type:complete
MSIKKTVFILLFSFSLSLDTVKNIDIEKFMGTWYVIASIPSFVEKNCINAYDIYTLNEDGTIDIKYYAQKNGRPFNISQRGTIVDTINNSTWRISFPDYWIPFYTAPYEVVVLEPDNYEYMVVGYPGNSFGWVMSRSKYMDKILYSNIMDNLEDNFGYDKNQFEMMIHKDAP